MPVEEYSSELARLSSDGGNYVWLGFLIPNLGRDAQHLASHFSNSITSARRAGLLSSPLVFAWQQSRSYSCSLALRV